jgi:predicted O-linked N-acetylglucosamine transferase (SPINDLY family)
LNAVGVPELSAPSLEAYEEQAKMLACDSSALAAIRAKLLANRDTHPLFDTSRFTHHLEVAYVAMWERQQRGLAPAGFAVDGAAAAASP